MACPSHRTEQPCARDSELARGEGRSAADRRLIPRMRAPPLQTKKPARWSDRSRLNGSRKAIAMQDIAAGTPGRKGWRRPDAAAPPALSDRLHALAHRVERLGISGRTDPE